jgi:hypothetical protein
MTETEPDTSDIPEKGEEWFKRATVIVQAQPRKVGITLEDLKTLAAKAKSIGTQDAFIELMLWLILTEAGARPAPPSRTSRG